MDRWDMTGWWLAWAVVWLVLGALVAGLVRWLCREAMIRGSLDARRVDCALCGTILSAGELPQLWAVCRPCASGVTLTETETTTQALDAQEPRP